MNLILKGSTDVTRYIVLKDSTTGAPETSYTITNLDLQYTRNRTAPAAKVDATALAATDSAHGDNKAIEIDATSSPGLYRVDWPDAAFASGVDKVLLVVSGTGIDPAIEEIQLVNFNPEDGVRLGLTALPNAAAEAAGGLYTRGSGAGQINQAANGQVDVNVTHAAGTAWNSGAIVANTIGTGAIDADSLAADAGTEIATAVWASATRSLTVLDEDSTTLDLDATIRAAVGLAAANLDTQLTAIDDFIDTEITTLVTNVATILTAVDTEVAAIKAKTDSLTFTVAGQVDANIQYVNDVQVTGTGAAGDEWGP